jgi:hypothetical protein
MYGKARLTMALLISSIMARVRTLIVTRADLRLGGDLLWRWAKAYPIVWPAAATAYVALPTDRRIIDPLIAFLDGTC